MSPVRRNLDLTAGKSTWPTRIKPYIPPSAKNAKKIGLTIEGEYGNLALKPSTTRNSKQYQNNM